MHNAPQTPAGGGAALLGEGALPAPRRTNHYRNGRQFELRVRADLTAAGYWVLGSPGSKTKVDVLAVKPREILLVQCKKVGAAPLSAAEWNALLDIVAVFPPGITIPILAVGGRGHRYFQLTGRKTKRGHRPMVPFHLDRLAA